jgi:hypothetical protein
VSSPRQGGEGYRAFSTLTPASFNEDPSTMPVHPAMGNPVHAGTRRRCPSAGHPGISCPVPPMIPSYPNEPRTGRNAPRLNDCSRWCNPNHNLRGGCTESERTRENQPNQSFAQHTLLLIPERGKSDVPNLYNMPRVNYAIASSSSSSAQSTQLMVDYFLRGGYVKCGVHCFSESHSSPVTNDH